jgi:hypothetical protein
MPWHGKADRKSQSYKLETEHDERVSRVSRLVEQGSKSPGRCGDNARYPANHSRVRDDEATLDFGALRAMSGGPQEPRSSRFSGGALQLRPMEPT